MYTYHDIVTIFFVGVVFGIILSTCVVTYVGHVLPKKLKRLRMKNKRRAMYDLPHLRRVK